MQTAPLHFRLKGKRQYIHGPDIYNVMVGQVVTLYPHAALGAVRLAAHRITVMQCQMVCGAPRETVAKPPNGVSQLQISTSLGAVEAWLVEGSERVGEVIEYDEDRMEQLCAFDAREVRITDDTGYTTAETVVAMTKFLHQRLYGPAVGKWLFTRFDLSRPFVPADVTRLRVQFLEDVGGGKLTRSAIYVGDERIGYTNYAARKS